MSYTVADVVTPSNTVDLPLGKCDAIYVGATGDVNAVVSGAAVVFKAMPVGLHPIACTRIASTSTTATDIVALYGND